VCPWKWGRINTGTTKEGERLYQFTHRTFLEYFAAVHLVRTNPTPQELIRTLIDRIASREWDVVVQLSFQLQNRNVEGAGDELLSSLITRSAISEGREQLNILSFAVRCLGFIVPSPKIIRQIATTVIDFALSSGKRSSRERDENDFLVIEILGNILQSTEENLPTVANAIERHVTTIIAGDYPQKVTRLALEIGLNLDGIFSFSRRKWEPNQTYWREC
jgi:hypothetical protein